MRGWQKPLAGSDPSVLEPRVSAVEAKQTDQSKTKTDWINVVEAHGADPTGTIDSTTAINNAIASSYSNGRYRPVYFPAGTYKCSNVQWDNKTPLIGAEVGYSILAYNGPGGAGSAIIVNPTNGGATPYTGFYNLTFNGYNGGEVAETCYKVTGTTEVDWGFKIFNCHFTQCFGDAVDLGTGIVNIHLDRIRFDAIGGFCLVFRGTATHENRPVTVSRFTWDNKINNAAFETKAISDGYYNGAQFGKGFANIINAKSCFFYFSHARIELNKQLTRYNNQKSIFYIDNTLSGTQTNIHLEQIVGFFQTKDVGYVVHAVNSRTTFSYKDCNFTNTTKLFRNSLTGNDVNTRGGIQSGGVYNSNEQGVVINGSLIEYRQAKPDTSVFVNYKKGDIINRQNAVVGEMLGWVVTSPSTGYACPAGQTITSTATVTSGSATVTITDQAAMYQMGIDANIVLVGAGVAGVDLNTRITAVDDEARTITVATPPSMSVANATIKMQTPVFTEFGQIGAKTSILSAPLYVGQLAVVGGIGYMATGTSSASDWKQITT